MTENQRMRRDLETEARKTLTHKMGRYATDAQIKAGARKLVDIVVAQTRRNGR